jgi:hypothetical protein
MNPITVNNLPFDELDAHNIYDADFHMVETMNLRQVSDTIEYCIQDICTMVIKQSMNTMVFTNPSPLAHNENYVIVGGKALNEMVSRKFMKQSFNYDVRVFPAPNQDPLQKISEVGNKITHALNQYLTLSHKTIIRKQMYQCLCNHGFVDTNQLTNYTSDTLFYYGKRISRTPGNAPIYGIFMKLCLRENIFGLHRYTNFNPNNNNQLYPDLPTPGNWTAPLHNALYFPIFDIDSAAFNFGIPIGINQQMFISTGSDGLPYASFMYLIYNLIMYIQTPHALRKQSKNLAKLKKLLIVNNYSCDLLKNDFPIAVNNTYVTISTALTTANANVLVTMNPPLDPPVMINKIDILPSNVGMHIIDILHNVNENIKNITNGIFTTKSICDTPVLNSNATALHAVANADIFDNISDTAVINTHIAFFEKIVATEDTNKFVFCYTDASFSRPLNLYCNYMSLNLPINPNIPNMQNIIQHQITFADTTSHIINVIFNPTIEWPTVCHSIDSVFDKFHQSIHLNIQSPAAYAYAALKNSFVVYSFQDIYTFASSEHQRQITIDYLKKGDIFTIPCYISTSFSKSYDFQSFTQYYRTLFKITIPKTSRHWIILNSYSIFPQEKEILLKRNSVFVITDISYETLLQQGEPREYRTISIQLHDNLQSALNYADTVVPYNINAKPITADPRFIHAVNYAYENYLSKQYLYDAANDDKQFGVWRPNHALANSLRKSAYIPIIIAYLHKAMHLNIIAPTSHLRTYVYTYHSVLKLTIAALFAVCGRKSEDSYADDPIRYTEYLTDSANIFAMYIRTQPELFNNPDENRMLISIITNRYGLRSTVSSAWISCAAHDLEMMRLHPGIDLSEMIPYIHHTDIQLIVDMAQECLDHGGEAVHPCLIPGFVNKPHRRSYDGIKFAIANTDYMKYLDVLHKILYADSTSIGLPGNLYSVPLNDMEIDMEIAMDTGDDDVEMMIGGKNPIKTKKSISKFSIPYRRQNIITQPNYNINNIKITDINITNKCIMYNTCFITEGVYWTRNTDIKNVHEPTINTDREHYINTDIKNVHEPTINTDREHYINTYINYATIIDTSHKPNSLNIFNSTKLIGGSSGNYYHNKKLYMLLKDKN